VIRLTCDKCREDYTLNQNLIEWDVPWYCECHPDEDHVVYEPQVITASDAALAIERLQADESIPTEYAHVLADRILLDLIGDSEVTKAFVSLSRWYS